MNIVLPSAQTFRGNRGKARAWKPWDFPARVLWLLQSKKGSLIMKILSSSLLTPERRFQKLMVMRCERRERRLKDFHMIFSDIS
jgi:hypothetical protein